MLGFTPPKMGLGRPWPMGILTKTIQSDPRKKGCCLYQKHWATFFMTFILEVPAAARVVFVESSAPLLRDCRLFVL
jgi:hypothetical protein